MDSSSPPRPGATEGPGALSPLEREVLKAMLKGEGCAALRAQLAGATLVSRTHSGVGFVARLAVGPLLTPLETPPPRLRPVLATHPQLEEPAEFLLQLRDGRLAVLEAYCCAGSWPLDESEFRLLG